MQDKQPKVALIMGSDSDFEVLKPCIRTLNEFGVEVDVNVISAHRTPDLAEKFASAAQDNGFEVIIGAAGKAAHLAGVLAAFTTLPVIGIPVKSSTMDGLDSLLSMVQMPAGIPVATVAIDGAQNAGLLAVQMLSLKYPHLQQKLTEYKAGLKEKTIAKNAEIKSKAAQL